MYHFSFPFLIFPKEILEKEWCGLEEMQAVLICWATFRVEEVERRKDKGKKAGRRKVRACGEKE